MTSEPRPTVKEESGVEQGCSNPDHLVPELREYDRQFSAIRRDAELLLDGLTERELVWHAERGTWSIVECLNHLAVSGNQSLSNIRSAIVDARSKGLLGAGPFRHSFHGNVLIRLMDAPPVIRFKVPKAYRPLPDVSVAEVLTAFFLCQDELARVLRDANGLDLARVKVANPVSNWFRLSLGQEFALTAAHERRHLWQALRVRNKLSSTDVASH